MNISLTAPPPPDTEAETVWYQAGTEIYHVRPNLTICFDQMLNKIWIAVGPPPDLSNAVRLEPGTRIEIVV